MTMEPTDGKGINKLSISEEIPSSPNYVTFVVHTPEGEEVEKPLFEENTFVPLVDLPPPPDGGWGWVICFSCFMCNMILDGICYTFGVLLEPLVEAFGSNRSTISWVGSILAGVYLMSGPIVGGLVNKFGCRPVCIGGSIISCFGIAISTLSPNVPVLMITYGVIGGFGLGLIYVPAVISVGYYFEKRRALATGISVCGSGVGCFIFPPLATFLLDEYGWRGANLIFAGFCLNCVVFGALMRPLELTIANAKTKNTKNRDNIEENFTVLLPDGTHHHQMPSPSVTPNISFCTNNEDNAQSINLAHLPTIVETENSITKKDYPSEPHKSIHEIFPEKIQPQRGSSKRIRQFSESQNTKFNVTPIRQNLPRNSTAPNFIDPKTVISRNSSTVGFNGLLRLSSQCSDNEYHSKVLGLNGSQLLSNTTLHLEPHSLSRRNSSRPIVRPLYRKDAFFSGSVNHLINSEQKRSMTPSTSQIFDYRHSIISIPRHSRRQSSLSIHRGSIVASHLSIPPSVRKASIIDKIDDEGAEPIISGMKEMTNLDMLKNKLFLLIGISNALGMLGFYVPFVYLPNMAYTNGIDKHKANFLISMIGISNTIGRVLAGWISDFSWVDSFVFTNCAIILSGLSVLILPLVDSYIAYGIIALGFGAFVAAYISLTSIVLVDLLGLDNLTSAFGLLVMFRGVSSIVGPPLAGAVFDYTKSYDISFYMAGGFLIIAAAVSIGADVLRRREWTKKVKP